MSLRILLSLAAAGLLACGDPPESADPVVRVQVDRVAWDSHDLPVVILAERHGPRMLPIWIGIHEARSIAGKMRDEPAVRPNTHDLAERIIRDLEGELDRVVVSELRGHTYIARMEFRRDGRTVRIDARPSDAIAIALRADAPIYVSSSLLEEIPVAADEDAPRRGI
jgi:bifunctional DNase/RNase